MSEECDSTEGTAAKYQQCVSKYQNGTTPASDALENKRSKASVHAAGNSASGAPEMPVNIDVVKFGSSYAFPAEKDPPYSPPLPAEGPRKRVLGGEGYRVRSPVYGAWFSKERCEH